MAQHDFNIANAGGATVRADINNVLSAIQSNNSGSSAPSSTVAGMFWLDTSGDPYVLKIRDKGNNHWLTVANVTDPGSDGNLSVSAIEGTAVLSTGESGGTKFLREDSDGSCSWQEVTGIPAGMIAPMGMASAPTGWLACDGSAVSKSTYSALYSALGANAWGTDTTDNFYLPDLEGAFLRGTGSHGTHQMAKEGGSDHFTGPNVGSFEDDQMQNHAHNGRYAYNSGIGTSSNQSPSTSGGTTGAAHQNILEPIEYSSQGTPRVGDETRPFNAGVKYCIKF
jgi:microcystin-dependent protein